jgi:hypothetical protein
MKHELGLHPNGSRNIVFANKDKDYEPAKPSKKGIEQMKRRRKIEDLKYQKEQEELIGDIYE